MGVVGEVYNMTPGIEHVYIFQMLSWSFSLSLLILSMACLKWIKVYQGYINLLKCASSLTFNVYLYYTMIKLVHHAVVLPSLHNNLTLYVLSNGPVYGSVVIM